jgi:hypothetical protein
MTGDRKTALRDRKSQSNPHFNQDCPFDGIFFTRDNIPFKRTAISYLSLMPV